MAFREHTYLDRIVESVVDVEDEALQEKVDLYSSQLLRNAAFFFPGKAGMVATVGLGALGQAKPEDSPSEQIADAALGAAKGGLLRATMHGAGKLAFTPVETGITLGLTSRILDAGLTRSTYFDSSGQVDMVGGLQRSFSRAVDPMALAVDAGTFGLAATVHHGLSKTGVFRGIGAPLYTNIATGATMGFSTGAFREIERQHSIEKRINLGAVLREGAISSLIDSTAAVPGGVAKMRSSVPYIMERGKLVLEPESAASKSDDLSTHRLVAGKVVVPFGGKVDVVVHGAGAAGELPEINRYPQNRLLHHLNRELGFTNGNPEVGTRRIVVDGEVREVWIQRMAGVDLENGLPLLAKAKYGSSEPADIVRLVNETPALREQLGTALYERLLFGDLDAWGKQYMMPGAEKAAQKIAENPAASNIRADLRVQNIDGDFMFLPHRIPSWSMKATWGLMNNIHRQFAGRTAPTEALARTERLIERYQTPEGRAELLRLGASEAEVDGLLARANWFLTNRTYPPAQPDGPLGMFKYADENTAAGAYSSARARGEQITPKLVEDVIKANKELADSTE